MENYPPEPGSVTQSPSRWKGQLVFSVLLWENFQHSPVCKVITNPVGGWGITHMGMRNRTKFLEPYWRQQAEGNPCRLTG